MKDLETPSWVLQVFLLGSRSDDRVSNVNPYVAEVTKHIASHALKYFGVLISPKGRTND